MNLVMTTLIQCCKHNVKLTTSSKRRYYNFAPMLHQLYEKCKMWTIHGHIVTFPKPCLKVAKKFINGMTLSSMRDQYYDIKLGPLISFYTQQFPKVTFKISCSLVA